MTQRTKVITDIKLHKNRIVRRYLDLPKYLDLLRSQTLYLNRADGFSDRFEGALTPIFRKTLNEIHMSGKAEDDAEYFYRRTRKGNFVSCWSLGAKDNMALWQLYGGANNSVAITSTIGKLVKMAFLWQEHVEIRKVKYIDHFKNPDMIIGSYYDFLGFKHLAYKYENEVRIIVPRQHDRWEQNPENINLPAGNLNDIIRSIVVAPEAGDWFYELVSDVTKKYGVKKPVRRSKLTYLPK